MHKEAALAFLKQVTAGKIREAYGKYVHPDFHHHNVWFKGDRQSLLTAMEENQTKFPAKQFEVKKAVEEGDTVITFSRLKMANMPEMAVVHVMRFRDGLIIEMWDVGQQIPKDNPNENGAF